MRPIWVALWMAASAAALPAQDAKPASSSWVDSRAEREWLLHPKALPHRAPVDAVAARSGFARPPAEYGSMPLWVWNDELEWPRLREQLHQFKAQGIGGVFVHPRPGLMTPYMSEKWWEMWTRSLEEGKRLGLTVNIYDENSYPSGFAGGMVPSQAPETVAQFMQPEVDVDFDQIHWTRTDNIAVFAIERDASGTIVAARPVENKLDWPKGARAIVFRAKKMRGNPWSGDFAYIDVTNPRTAQVFLETTFEPYRKRYGSEFGKTIKWIFDDEANIATGGAEMVGPVLPFGYNTVAEFQKRNGYDLTEHLPSLFWDLGDYRKVRFDYWQTLHDLWKENYVRALFAWCDKNNVQFTGHWLEHEWPYPYLSPADASLFAYMHMPGIDMLRSHQLWREGVDSHMLFTIKEVASVAHQMGKRAFVEAYGGAGFDSTFEYYKRMGDWLIVHGINAVDQHLSYSTIRGARKRDYPQSFSDVAEWWANYRPHGEHLHRLSYALSQGVARNRVLVIPATTSGFLAARRHGPQTELENL
ncbi:MAG TPA: glycosyl hydrolase, partial [Bryobacteraceae bacterium]|nr:glycosyl hydrolase [Bryobacteraceae bacterium]